MGKAWYHQMMRSGNVDFSCRSSVVKWIYEHDFVSDFAKLDSVKRIQDVSHPSGRGVVIAYCVRLYSGSWGGCCRGAGRAEGAKISL